MEKEPTSNDMAMLQLESLTLDVQTLQRYREEHKQDCLDSSNSGKNVGTPGIRARQIQTFV
jgi:hypothetical protein